MCKRNHSVKIDPYFSFSHDLASLANPFQEDELFTLRLLRLISLSHPQIT